MGLKLEYFSNIEVSRCYLRNSSALLINDFNVCYEINSHNRYLKVVPINNYINSEIHSSCRKLLLHVTFISTVSETRPVFWICSKAAKTGHKTNITASR